jgi:hypothetical protein
MMRKAKEDKLLTLSGVTCTAATAKAMLIRDCDGAEHWIPRSQTRDENPEDGGQTTISDKGDEGDLVITEWIATQKGMI